MTDSFCHLGRISETKLRENEEKMAKFYLAIFVALLPFLVECHWTNIARRLRQGDRRKYIEDFRWTFFKV